MDFDGAIKAHAAWKMRLTQYLARPDRSLDPTVVERNDQCPLGQWIAGEGRAFVGSPLYRVLSDEHTQFHRAAADIVRRADSGQDVASDVALGASSPFATASVAVVGAIMKMKVEVAAAA